MEKSESTCIYVFQRGEDVVFYVLCGVGAVGSEDWEAGRAEEMTGYSKGESAGCRRYQDEWVDRHDGVYCDFLLEIKITRIIIFEFSLQTIHAPSHVE